MSSKRIECGEYYYSRHKKRWINIRYYNCLDSDGENSVKPAVLEKLKDPKLRRQCFLKIVNHYNTSIIDAGYVYIETDAFGLVISDSVYLRYTDGVQLIYIKDLANPEILKHLNPDPSNIVDFLDVAMYLHEYTEEGERGNWERHVYWMKQLTPEQRLIYEVEGHYPGKKYD